MNFASLSKNWPGQSRNSTMRLLRRLRRQVRLFKLNLGQNLDQIRSRGEWSGWFQLANPLSRITIGRLAQIDRTAKLNAPPGSLIRIGNAVRLGRQTRLSARREGEIILGAVVSLGQETEIIAQAGCVEIGAATSLGPFCRLFSAATLKIGRNCQFGRHVTLHAQAARSLQSGGVESGGTRLGRLGPAVRPERLKPNGLKPNDLRLDGLKLVKLDNLKPASLKSTSRETGSIVIEDHCWIGNNVQIAAGVTIGQHSVVGDDAVILSDVPAFSVAAGSPAKTRSGALREVVAPLTDDYKTLSQLALKSYLNQLSQR